VTYRYGSFAAAVKVKPVKKPVCSRCGSEVRRRDVDDCLGCGAESLCIPCMAEHDCGVLTAGTYASA
jgi:hypothetical protein